MSPQVVITSFCTAAGPFQSTADSTDDDAVISQGNYSSLNVLGTLLVATLAQALLGSLRTYLFSDTTNRIDISLGATIIITSCGCRWGTSPNARWGR